MHQKSLWNLFIVGIALLSFSGCAPYLHQPLSPKSARLGADTETLHSFAKLPPAKEKIVAAVYKFRDQTGQYKPSASGASWSTAVTQGSTSILLRALEESQWFLPIERENLSNLLNERKIIRSSRAEYETEQGKNQPVLPPLLFAGIILEGGIISYDANMITGGAGLRYFGAGASGQYREDRITVYLRAVSTSNGRVLKTVYTSRTILSQMVDVGLFRFVKFKRLLEAETGFTHNEPTEIAVKDAIEKAVHSLILEGMIEGLWAPQDETQLQGQAVREYQEEKTLNNTTDYLGRYKTNRRSTLGIGLGGGGLLYAGDYRSPQLRPMATAKLLFNTADHWAYGLRLSWGELGTQNFYRSKLSAADLFALYRFYPKERYTPYLLLSSGAVGNSSSGSEASLKNIFPQAGAGLGLEYLLTNTLGMHAEGQYQYVFSDRFDAIRQGKRNDAYWRFTLGIQLYF